MPGVPGRPPRSPTARPTPTRCRRMPASARKPLHAATRTALAARVQVSGLGPTGTAAVPVERNFGTEATPGAWSGLPSVTFVSGCVQLAGLLLSEDWARWSGCREGRGVRLADGARRGQRPCQQVADLVAGGAGVRVQGLAVPELVDGQQAGVAQVAGGGNRVAVVDRGIAGVAEDQDRVCGTPVPRPRVAVLCPVA